MPWQTSNQLYDPISQGSTIAPLAISIIYYVVIALATFVSVAAIYALIKNGRSRGLSLIVSAVYILFFLTLIAQGTNLLGAIK